MHIMIRGNNKQLLFREEVDKRYYRFLLRKYMPEHALDLHHYCLMNNHIHLVIQAHQEDHLSTAMKRVNLAYYHLFKNKYRYCGHLVQDRFKSNILSPYLGLPQCGKYNELNPVRAKIVADPADYKYSSYRFYARGEKDPLISPSPWYLSLSSDSAERRKIYEKLIIQPNTISTQILLGQRYVGEAEFLKSMEEKYKLPAILGPKGRPSKK